MKLVPIIAMVPEAAVARIDHINTERWDTMPPDVRDAMEAVCEQNGWTRFSMTAGVLVGAGLDEAEQNSPIAPL